jgi:acyl-CoA thioester hydrolase
MHQVILEPDRRVAARSGEFARPFVAGWASIDANGHLANTSYLDLAADARISFFAEHGFSPSDFRALSIGPVIQREQLEYFKEIHLHQTVIVTFAALGMSIDASRFIVENEIRTESGARSAIVRSTGGWLDLTTRQLAVPPPPLRAAMAKVPRVPGFVELPRLDDRPRD